jgi:hypothetical protein
MKRAVRGLERHRSVDRLVMAGGLLSALDHAIALYWGRIAVLSQGQIQAGLSRQRNRAVLPGSVSKPRLTSDGKSDQSCVWPVLCEVLMAWLSSSINWAAGSLCGRALARLKHSKEWPPIWNQSW